MWSGFDGEAKSCWSRFENGLIYLDSKYEIQKECENRRCEYISLSHFPLFLLFHNFRNNLATVTRAYFASRSLRYRFCSPEYQINYTCSGLQAIFPQPENSIRHMEYPEFQIGIIWSIEKLQFF